MGIDKNGILKGAGGAHKVVKGETEGGREATCRV